MSATPTGLAYAKSTTMYEEIRMQRRAKPSTLDHSGATTFSESSPSTIVSFQLSIRPEVTNKRHWPIANTHGGTTPKAVKLEMPVNMPADASANAITIQ